MFKVKLSEKKVYITTITIIAIILITIGVIFYPFLSKAGKEVEIKTEVKSSQWMINRTNAYNVFVCNFDLKKPEYIYRRISF